MPQVFSKVDYRGALGGQGGGLQGGVRSGVQHGRLQGRSKVFRVGDYMGPRIFSMVDYSVGPRCSAGQITWEAFYQIGD